MKSVLSNKWLQLGVSLLTAAYLALIGILAYWTFLYEIRFLFKKTAAHKDNLDAFAVPGISSYNI